MGGMHLINYHIQKDFVSNVYDMEDDKSGVFSQSFFVNFIYGLYKIR